MFVIKRFPSPDRRWNISVLVVVLSLISPVLGFGSSTLPVSEAAQIAEAAGVVRGEIIGVETFTRGEAERVFTCAHLRVDEVLKGEFPDVVKLVHRGDRMASVEVMTGLGRGLGSGGAASFSSTGGRMIRSLSSAGVGG